MRKFNRNSGVLLAATVCLAFAGCLSSSDEGLVTSAPGNGGSGGSGGSGSTNSAPTISGNPAPAVNVGDAYSFRPTASDPDGDTLNFEIANRPSWASFDTNNGEVSGTPSMGDIGSYDNISITVTDGQASASTPAFSVDVSQVQLGSVTLSWTAPTQNSDGSSLNDLDAYKIYFGNSQGSYPNQVRIDNPSITTYVVDNLAPDTYFFVATSVNSQGVESAYSNAAQVTVN